MTRVRMLVDMQGGRHDNQQWPGYKGVIDVPQWEADQLIRGGNAEPYDAPDLNRGWDVLRAATPDYESYLERLDGENEVEDEEEGIVVAYDDDDDDFDRRDDEDEVTTQVKRPATSDNKAAWIAWAVSQGATVERASAKTKAQLIADY